MYAISIISTSGIPFSTIMIQKEPQDIDLAMHFFTFSLPLGEMCPGSFELEAGLMSALYEFSRCVDQPIETLKFRHVGKINKEVSEDKIIYKNKHITIEYPVNSDILITTRNEKFINRTALEAKIIVIYSELLRKYTPIGPERELSPQDQQNIIDILINKDQIDLLKKRESNLKEKIKTILETYKQYGLESIVICGFDLQPIFLGIEDADLILSMMRDIETFPFVEPFEWRYRTSFVKGTEYWIYIVNSGLAVDSHNIKMNYYYMLITKEGSFLGETPYKILTEINEILFFE